MTSCRSTPIRPTAAASSTSAHPCHRIPTEADLAAIFEVAELAGIVWLKFDSEAAVIDGLPIFEMPDPAS
jgi:hypothetical protein